MQSKSAMTDALVKAQSEMSHAVLDQVNPHFKSKFASLKSVIDAVKPALNNNGIAFVQEAVQVDGMTYIETVLYGHGETLRTGPVPVVADKQNAQGFGSGMTYAKRYSLSMALGVSAESDDDGNAASNAPPKKRGQSVIQTVIDENGMKADEEKVYQYEKALLAAVQNNDELGVNELIDELNGYKDDGAMKTFVWKKLPSNVRTSITKMRGEKLSTSTAKIAGEKK